MLSSMDLVEIDDYFDLQRVRVGNNDTPVHGGEVQTSAPKQAVVRPLYLDVDAHSGASQANRIFLLQTSDPHICPQLKNSIRVGLVRLRALDQPIVGLPRKSRPRIST